MPSMSPTGRHVTAAEALQLGIVDQVTDRDTVETAVKFALSITGETHGRRCRAKSRFLCLKIHTVKGRWNPYRSVIFGQVRHQEVAACRLCESDGAEKNTRQADPPPQQL